MKDIPLGGRLDFEYKLKDTSLRQGDTILLMSDGFPELFNKKKKFLIIRRGNKFLKKQQ